MKNYTLLISFLLLSILSLGQKADRKAQMDALKIQFLTEELDLTQEEADKFWPVFFVFEKDHKKIKKQIRQKTKSIEGAEIEEKELKSLLSELKSLEIQLAELKEGLILNSIPILGVEKSVKLMSSEDKLKRKIGDRIKTQMKENRP